MESDFKSNNVLCLEIETNIRNRTLQIKFAFYIFKRFLILCLEKINIYT